MRLRIHHGATEIGGNCIELESGDETLLLDLGLPLDGDNSDLPSVAGLRTERRGLLGVILSHPHLDHYGLLPHADPSMPVWLGEGALRLLDAAAPFVGSAFPQIATPYRDREPFEVGPFRITPYLMDHSAYDAHALLVEACGRRLLYTGDFRGHGRKQLVFERFLADPPRNIDLLLMEGTTLGRDAEVITESDVEDEIRRTMADTPGIVLVCLAGQNIDRLVGLFRASLRAGRTLIVDVYTACLVDGLGLDSLPDMATHQAIRIYLPRSQRRRIIAGRRFDLVDRYRSRRIFMPEIAADSTRFTMLVRSSMINELKPLTLTGGALIWSLWPGYLERDRTDLRRWAEVNGLAFHLIHASGHAHHGDLKRMAERLAPARLMPIHTRHPERYRALYPKVEILPNGSWGAV